MKAIKTIYLSPTDKRGARIKATDLDRNSITIPYDHCLCDAANHVAAAQALCDKMDWPGKRLAGSLSNYYVHVFVAGRI